MMVTLFNEDDVILNQLKVNIESCILGKETEVELLIAAVLAGGHVLLEDVPGTGKTVLIKALARSLQGQFHRIQCNPDLLPTDITGVSIYHPKQEEFLFRPGPIFTNQRAVLEFDRFLRYAKKKGYTRLEHETVREAVQRWFSNGDWSDKDELELLIQLFEKAKYSDSSISEEDLSALTQKVHVLKKKLSDNTA